MYNKNGFLYMRGGTIVCRSQPGTLTRIFPDGTGGPLVLVNVGGVAFAIPDVIERLRLRIVYALRHERVPYTPRRWRVWKFRVVPNKECPFCGQDLVEIPDAYDPRDTVCAACGNRTWKGS